MYPLYVAGSTVATFLPRGISYWLACRGADLWSAMNPQDVKSVRANLEVILGTPDVPADMVRDVFRNFSMYLVDFFRYGSLNKSVVERSIRIEGLEHMQSVLAEGKGAIGLSAHIGNFELAGAVLSLMGVPVNAVVLTHRNHRIDAFFNRQRARVGMKAISIQKMSPRAFFDRCMSVLKQKEMLALVGDRDFFQHGLELPLFGKSIMIPTGPANFSVRTGAPIVPAFMLREKDGGYRLVVEEPIRVPLGVSREEAVRKMTEACLNVIAAYISRYPSQWYGFREFWRQVPAVII